MPGTSSTWLNDSLQLPFNQAVVQLAHHSYNPDKGCSLHPCPGTFHWSNFAISQAQPFTMLRPQQPLSLHEGRNPILQLPQPAPANAFLRFAAIGQIQASFDGGKSFQPAQLQAQPKHSPEGFSSYWTPVPAGTTSVAFKGQPPNGANLPYWIEDVSVWSRSAPSSVAEAPPPPAAARPPEPGPAANGQARGPAAAAPSSIQASSAPQRALRAVMAKAAAAARTSWSLPSFLLGLIVPLLVLAIFVGWRRHTARRAPPPDPQGPPS
jgi:hypothetical protein